MVTAIILAALTFGTNVPTSIRYGTNQVQTVRYGTNVVWTSGVTAGLVAWWKMDEGIGTNITDYSGQGNKLTLQGGAFWSGGRLYFNGTNGLALSLNGLGESSNCVTVMAWVKANSTTADQYIIAKNNATTYRGIILGFQDGYWNTYNTPGYPIGGNATLSRMAASTNWEHVVYTSCGTSVVGYVNGVLKISGSGNLNSTDTNAWRIGQYSSGSPFGGFIRDVRIYNRALTSNEIWSISR